jgi:hypothetical protein
MPTTSAFLVTGKEFRHRKKILRFRDVLEKSDCNIEVVSAHSPFFFKELLKAVSRTTEDSVFLFAFYGHGDPTGYEGGADYVSLAIILSKIKGRLVIINDTCFGLEFLKHIQARKDSSVVCFISSWDSAGESYGGPVRDAIQFWPQSKITEDCVLSQIHLTDDGEKEYPPQQHWGSRFEHYFFPKNS